jgi:hypothetical protein
MSQELIFRKIGTKFTAGIADGFNAPTPVFNISGSVKNIGKSSISVLLFLTPTTSPSSLMPM